MLILCRFFFFKQNTAYEMRISDWSSDVCSSDLPVPVPADLSRLVLLERATLSQPAVIAGQLCVLCLVARGLPDRKSVVWGKSVSVRVDLGGRRIIKKKNNNKTTYRHYYKHTEIYRNCSTYTQQTKQK